MKMLYLRLVPLVFNVRSFPRFKLYHGLNNLSLISQFNAIVTSLQTFPSDKSIYMVGLTCELGLKKFL